MKLSYLLLCRAAASSTRFQFQHVRSAYHATKTLFVDGSLNPLPTTDGVTAAGSSRSLSFVTKDVIDKRQYYLKRSFSNLRGGDYDTVTATKAALSDLINEKNCGPILIRLAWHDAGTFDCTDGSGGPRGCMRFHQEGSEANFEANSGLDIARALVQPIKEEFAPNMSYADFWALASIVAIKEMGGPDVKFRIGRKDATSVKDSVQEGRHPDGDKGSDHLREIFHRMGLTDQDIVILSGAHTVGRCRLDRSGFDGAWTENPFQFDNSYFVDLLNKEWKETTTSAGNPQFESDNDTMMLISDLALVSDEKFRTFVEKYAADQQAFFDDFAESYQKLIELGCTDLQDV